MHSLALRQQMVFRRIIRERQKGRIAKFEYVFAAAIVFAVLCGLDGYAAEPWADSKMQVRDGLVLWLDAMHAAGDQPLPNDGKLNQWRDASGAHRDLQAPDKKARPSAIKVGDLAVARFDGIDDELRAVKLGKKLDS